MAPSISVREYIRWSPDPSSEPTETLVVTSAENRFVDIRILKAQQAGEDEGIHERESTKPTQSLYTDCIRHPPVLTAGLGLRGHLIIRVDHATQRGTSRALEMEPLGGLALSQP